MLNNMPFASGSDQLEWFERRSSQQLSQCFGVHGSFRQSQTNGNI
jgi:hypothetical protein